ncbi:MAG TPA: YtxH domain-containing protein [Candidatus Saccharimonadales bacterium]|jgi:gas vesicle protein|nr:YtxH domain-containing protein [Candidatus Saccharimonadales bacterium]
MARRNDHDTAKKIAIGSAIAGVAGFVAGVLTAPKSGKETREDIKETADRGVDEAEKDFKKLQDEVDKVIKQAKANRAKLSKSAQAELNDLIDKAKDGKGKAGEVFSAVRDGEAEDRDLDRAIKSASRSLDHLKKYLKK